MNKDSMGTNSSVLQKSMLCHEQLCKSRFWEWVCGFIYRYDKTPQDL